MKLGKTLSLSNLKKNILFFSLDFEDNGLRDILNQNGVISKCFVNLYGDIAVDSIKKFKENLETLDKEFYCIEQDLLEKKRNLQLEIRIQEIISNYKLYQSFILKIQQLESKMSSICFEKYMQESLKYNFEQ